MLNGTTLEQRAAKTLGGPGGSRTHGVLSEADYESASLYHANTSTNKNFPL
jgi:hypothetical protein